MSWFLVVYLHYGAFVVPITWGTRDACELAWIEIQRQDPARFENGKAAHACHAVKR